MTSLAYLLRGEDAVEASPGAEIKHGLAGLQRGKCDRVTATVTGAGHIRWDGSEQLLGVETVFRTAAIRRSAAGGVVRDPLRIMLADSFVNGRFCCHFISLI